MDQLDHPKEAIELPLKFEDIVDKTTYDKMRPPKPGGKLFILNLKTLKQRAWQFTNLSLSKAKFTFSLHF